MEKFIPYEKLSKKGAAEARCEGPHHLGRTEPGDAQT
jgi:hypothetical protein